MLLQRTTNRVPEREGGYRIRDGLLGGDRVVAAAEPLPPAPERAIDEKRAGGALTRLRSRMRSVVGTPGPLESSHATARANSPVSISGKSRCFKRVSRFRQPPPNARASPANVDSPLGRQSESVGSEIRDQAAVPALLWSATKGAPDTIRAAPGRRAFESTMDWLQ